MAEYGITRNFEPWREEKFIKEELDSTKQKQEEVNPMKALENRTMDSKREMEILDALDEIRTVNARAQRIDTDKMITDMVQESQRKAQEEQERIERMDDELAKSIFMSEDGGTVKRVLDDEAQPGISVDAAVEAEAQLQFPSFESMFKRPTAAKKTVNAKRKPLLFSSQFDGLIVKKKSSAVSTLAVSNSTVSTLAVSTLAVSNATVPDNSVSMAKSPHSRAPASMQPTFKQSNVKSSAAQVSATVSTSDKPVLHKKQVVPNKKQVVPHKMPTGLGLISSYNSDSE